VPSATRVSAAAAGRRGTARRYRRPVCSPACRGGSCSTSTPASTTRALCCSPPCTPDSTCAR
jgi:hypothetical protein